jgi:toxin ParE1/3/4
MKVALSETALADLAYIGAYITDSGSSQADAIVDEITDRCHRLGRTPLAFPLVPRQEDSGIRRCVSGSYLIFYRIVDDMLQVLRVLHGARDVDAILFPDD